MTGLELRASIFATMSQAHRAGLNLAAASLWVLTVFSAFFLILCTLPDSSTRRNLATGCLGLP